MRHLLDIKLQYAGQSIQAQRCLGKEQLQDLVVLGMHRLVARCPIAVDEPNRFCSNTQRRHNR